MKKDSSRKNYFFHRLTLVAGIALVGVAGVSAAWQGLDSEKPQSATLRDVSRAEEAEGEVVFTKGMSQESDFSACTLLTDNGDTNKWKYYKYGPYIRYNIYASDGVASDSYIFIPGASLKADKEYTISAETKKDASNDAFTTTFEFCVAPVAEIAQVLHQSTHEVTSKEFETVVSDKFSVPATGTYFIVLHANSPKINASGGYAEIHAKNISVTEYEKAVVPSDALPLPYDIVPTLEEMGKLSVLDNNGDEYDRGTFQLGVWNYDMQREQLVYYYSNSKQDADDYVFLPQLQFNDADKAYMVELDAMCGSRSQPESFALYIGESTDPTAMRCFYESGDVTNDEDWETFSVPVGVPAKGDYYVAIKATSPKERFKLMVKNISVTQLTTTSAVPEAPTGVQVQAADRGALSATVNFTIPQNDLATKSLSGNVDVVVASAEETKTVSGQPGETKSVVVTTHQGNNTITLTPSNANGTGNKTVVNVYTGVDIPRIPEPTASVSEDNLTLHIEWPSNEVGLNGGFVDPSTVTFTLSRYNPDTKEYDDGEELTGVYSYDYTVDADAPQHRESFIITAKNIAGHEEGSGSVFGMVGKPYNLPMTETLEGGRLSYEPVGIEIPSKDYLYSADFRVYDLATIFEKEDPHYPGIMDGHKKALWAFVRYGEAGKCRFVLPKFTTEGITETKFKMNVFVNDIFPPTDVYAEAYGMEPVKLGSITSESGEGWTDLTYVIPASFAGKKWVKVFFDAQFTDIDAQNIFISSYYVGEQLARDLAVVSISGPEDALSIGDKGEYTAVVRNEGKNKVDAPEVLFEMRGKNGEAVFTFTAKPSKTELAPEETEVYKVTVDATADNLGDYTVRAALTESDENPDNDAKEIAMSIIRGQKPVVNDLAAEVSGEDVALTWSKPDIKLTGFESFEDNEPFDYGRYLGLFRNIDLDGKTTYSYDKCQFDAATLPKAFMVINPEYLNNRLVGENYTPRSGDQYLVAFCPSDGSKADDWLISPEVKPGTVISFYITTVATAEFSEQVEVCYSSTTNDPSSFKPIAKESISGMNWQGKAYMLPDDARYFAIHYVSADVFGIMIDDIDFTPVINRESVFTYNVYADGAAIADGLTDTSFLHKSPARQDNRYNVTAVVDGTEYNMSNTAIPVLSAIGDAGAENCDIYAGNGSIHIHGYGGKHVVVYSIDGREIFYTASAGERISVAVPQGIYVVKAAADVKKVYVK